jgi:hypothetical protein
MIAVSWYTCPAARLQNARLSGLCYHSNLVAEDSRVLITWYWCIIVEFNRVWITEYGGDLALAPHGMRARGVSLDMCPAFGQVMRRSPRT